MLDLAVINARIVYMETMGTEISRRHFLIWLTEKLVSSHDQVEYILEEIPAVLVKRYLRQIL